MPLSPDALPKAFEKYSKFPSGVRGLKYTIGKKFFSVTYKPSGLAVSGHTTLKDYSIENGVVKGRDEASDDLGEWVEHIEPARKVYKRSVSFVARLPEKKS